MDASAIMKIAIPDKIEEVPVVEIADGAFSKCTSLEQVTLPKQLVEVGAKAFFGCTSLVSVAFPNEVDLVGDSAFEGCTSLESITLPKRGKMKGIGNKAFKDCSSLNSVTVPSKLKKVGGFVLGGIEGNAFVGCSSIPLKDQAALKQLGYEGKF